MVFRHWGTDWQVKPSRNLIWSFRKVARNECLKNTLHDNRNYGKFGPFSGFARNISKSGNKVKSTYKPVWSNQQDVNISTTESGVLEVTHGDRKLPCTYCAFRYVREVRYPTPERHFWSSKFFRSLRSDKNCGSSQVILVRVQPYESPWPQKRPLIKLSTILLLL